MRRVLHLCLAVTLGVVVATIARRILPPRWVGHEVSHPAKVVPIAAVEQSKAIVVPISSADVVPAHYRQDNTPTAPLYLTGYLVRGRRFNAVLSDGRTITELDSTVSEIRRNGLAMKDGTFLAFRTVTRVAPPAPPAPDKPHDRSPPSKQSDGSPAEQETSPPVPAPGSAVFASGRPTGRP